MCRFALCALLAAILGGTADVAAQSNATNVCWRGRPVAACRWFIITESRYHVLLTTDPPAEAVSMHYLLAETGLMRNVSREWAVGVTMWGAYDFGLEATRLGISARVRRWIRGGSIEGTLGPAYTSNGTTHDLPDALGATARLDWNVHDVVLLGLRAEWVPEGRHCPPQYLTDYTCMENVWTSPTTGYGIDRTEGVRIWRVYASAGVGSKPGVASWLGAGALGVLALAAQR